MFGFKRASFTVALAALAALAAQPVGAQGDVNYPTKPIRFVVGFAAGGGNDLFARLVGQKLSENIGQPVIIENKPGAGGRLAVEYALNQPADGYTLVVGATGQMAIAAAIYPKLPYHPTKSFVPITMIASFPLILAGPIDDQIKSVKDLIAYGKANPGKSNYATSSPAFTITTELFKLKSGMPAQAIPYKSSNEMMLSIAGGQTLFAIADGPPTMPLVQGGKVRALAVTGAVRSSRAAGRAEHGRGRAPRSEYRAMERRIRPGWNAARGHHKAGQRAPSCARRSRRAREAQGHGGQSRRRSRRGVSQAHRRRHQVFRRGREGRRSEIRAVGGAWPPAPKGRPG